MLEGLGTGLSAPLQPPWRVRNPLEMLPYDNYLDTGSRGPLDPAANNHNRAFFRMFRKSQKHPILTQICDKMEQK
jgi:hypothetical protein